MVKFCSEVSLLCDIISVIVTCLMSHSHGYNDNLRRDFSVLLMPCMKQYEYYWYSITDDEVVHHADHFVSF